PNDEYDSPWKQLIEWYFEPFMRFFFSEAHAQIDWERSIQFVDKELQQVARDADLGRRYADVLVKVWLLDGSRKWIFIHVEVQGQVDAHFDARMFTYNYRLFDKHGPAVASFAVLADEVQDWRPGSYRHTVLGSTVHFTYTTAKLLDYGVHWAALEADDNPFATVVMAHLKNQETKGEPTTRYDWKFYLIRRLFEQGYTQQDVVNLFHFIDWVMRLPGELEHQLREEIVQMEMRLSKPYVSVIERWAQEEGRREGREEGREEGRKEGKIDLLLHILTHRFGQVPEDIQARLYSLTLGQIDPLVDVALAEETLTAFVAQLPPPTAESATEV
ncbi:MAG: DUF4351 domain-containing protein, partial [Caldilineaceae bacterium]|nr:DUF4351 domain-containing protein [Caldilineaceae bacterium]